ncbi:group III truncated hemoglobin [Glaciimonas soli]|uniref:Globin n=1 Tax=Glaciimonas soli TaxID=2590999 RepID=A0A843YNC9_9BURK|nr:group III truncated hemoglobin [Glaciimonas soli]MQQ99283.1 globin [Glaciimonas soli]
MKLEINEASIKLLVENFYAEVRQDPVLSIVFANHIQGDWTSHLERMVKFWCSVVLGTGGFQGNVYGKHMAMSGIEPEHFARWLNHFELTTGRMFEAEQAAQFNIVAHRIGSSLQLGFFGEVVVP